MEFSCRRLGRVVLCVGEQKYSSLAFCLFQLVWLLWIFRLGIEGGGRSIWPMTLARTSPEARPRKLRKLRKLRQQEVKDVKEVKEVKESGNEKSRG